MNDNQFKVLIAPNSFKECADSVEIAEFIKAAMFKLLPVQIRSQIDFALHPISDGGDGFLQVCQRAFGIEFLHFEISFPFSDEKFFCPVGYYQESKTLYVESAEVLGLKNIPLEFRKPMSLSSKGMGELLLQIYDSIDSGILEVDKVIIGIGGTGTNDLGLGMMEEFGLELYDQYDNKLEVLPKNFSLVEKIIVPEFQSPFQIELICDVENPLIGEDGASKVFTLQKGASAREAEEMDKGFLKILTELEIDKKTIKELHGAGGGLAAAFKIFFNAEEKFASRFIQEDLGIHSKDSNYKLVITGEGKLDSQTLMNKGAMIVVDEFALKNIPVFFICGLTDGDLPKIDNMKVLELSEYFNTPEESIKKIEHGIELACKRIVKEIIQLFAKNNS